MELRIDRVDDRVTVAAILIKNGYTVSQVKRKRVRSSSYEYVLKAVIDDEKEKET